MKTLAPGSHAVFLLLCFSGVGTALLWLTWDLRPYPIPAAVDDYRYVLSASYIADNVVRGTALPWLGPYDTTTLFKRPGFSILLAVTSLLHLPFIQTILLLHLIAVGILVNSLLRLGYSRTVSAAVFIACSLYPTLYDSNAVRVIRETATGAIEIAVFGVCLALFTLRPRRRMDLFLSRWFLVLLGLLALHWSMREEAVLLLPGVFLLVNGAFWLCDDAPLRGKIVRAVIVSLVLFLPSQLMYFGIAALNQASYGVHLVNDVSEGSFPRAVSALKRVEETPCDDQLLTSEEIRKVMAVSPSFRMVGGPLAAALQAEPGKHYGESFAELRVNGVSQPDIGTSAPKTQNVFASVAHEVEAACASGQLRCAKRGSGGIVPLLCPAQWSRVPRFFVRFLADDIAPMSHSGLSPLWSGVPGIGAIQPEKLTLFETMTRQKMAGRNGEFVEFSKPASIERLMHQDYRRGQVSRVYAAVMPWLMGIGSLAFLLRLLFWRHGTSWSEWIILSSLAAHVLVRVAAFSYLCAVEDDLNTRFIGLAYPMAAAFAVLTTIPVPFLIARSLVARKPVPPRGAASRLLPAMALVTSFFVAAGYVYSGADPGLPLPEYSSLRTADLHIENGREVFEWQGQHIEIVPERQGWLHEMAGALERDTVVFNGWGMDVAASRPAIAVLLFANGRFVESTTPNIAEPSVESGFLPGEHAGFALRVPHSAVTGKRVRVFALLKGGRAGEMNYPTFYRYKE